MGEAPEEPAQPRAIVAGHGVFPEGLISAVEQITGRGNLFVAVSNAALGSEEIEAKLRGEAARSGVKVFFTDLPGGSATLAVRRMMRSDPALVLVTGSNLASLLEFVFHSDEEPRDAAGRAAEKGRASLAAYGGR